MGRRVGQSVVYINLYTTDCTLSLLILYRKFRWIFSLLIVVVVVVSEISMSIRQDTLMTLPFGSCLISLHRHRWQCFSLWPVLCTDGKNECTLHIGSRFTKILTDSSVWVGRVFVFRWRPGMFHSLSHTRGRLLHSGSSIKMNKEILHLYVFFFVYIRI